MTDRPSRAKLLAAAQRAVHDFACSIRSADFADYTFRGAEPSGYPLIGVQIQLDDVTVYGTFGDGRAVKNLHVRINEWPSIRKLTDDELVRLTEKALADRQVAMQGYPRPVR